jgi:uncharacterized membrane protein YdbT with pleckstrin-like domain
MKIHLLKPVIRWWSLGDSRLVAHFTETLEVHTDRFVHRRGVLSKRESVVLYSRITNYTADQNLFDRLFGVANFCIETAAGSMEPELRLRGYPYQLRSFLSKMLDRIVSLG